MVTVRDVSGIPDGRYVLGIRRANNTSHPDWLCRPEHLQGTVCGTPVATICQGHSPQNGCVTVDGRDWRLDGRNLARGVAPPGGSVAGDFRDLVPTNLCDLASGEMTGLALGNIAYLAGGTPPGGGGFSGGDITLGASTRADGAVLAGNVLTTGGSTSIGGAIVAAAQGAGDRVAMGGSTRLDLSGGGPAYDPGGLPCGIVECAPSSPGGARVLWTRYR